MCKVSVIVPIYNTEKYLAKCIESICNQTFRDIQIILVDDGSTDSSGLLCDRYATLDERIIVIHNCNQGVVQSRKAGLAVAKGELIAFIDSDDCMDELAIQHMYERMQDSSSDIVVCGYIIDKGNSSQMVKNIVKSGVYSKFELELIYRKLIFDDAYMQSSIIQSMCGKLFKKKLLLETSRDIDERITLGEDASFVFPYLLACNSICISDQCYYHYQIRNGSMCSKKDLFVFERIEAFQQYLTNKLTGYPAEYMLELQIKKYIVHLLEMAIRNNYGICYSKKYVFDSNLMNTIKGKNIIVYGAGEVGKDYVEVLLAQGITPRWVDKNKNGEKYLDVIIESIDIINEDTDVIVVAVLRQALYESIKNELTKYVDKEKVIWARPSVNAWLRNITFL